MQKPYDVVLDLYDTDKIQKTDIRYVAGDRYVYPLRILLTENEKPYLIPAGAVVTMRFKIESAFFIDNANIVSGEEGVISYEIPNSLVADVAVIECRVEVKIENKLLTWPTPFMFKVLDSDTRWTMMPPEYSTEWQHEVDEKLDGHEQRISDLKETSEEISATLTDCGQRIVGLEEQDEVTSNMVAALEEHIEGLNFLDKSGGEMSGRLEIQAGVYESEVWKPPLRIPHWRQPWDFNSVVDGDLWTTEESLHGNINGVNRMFYHDGNIPRWYFSKTYAELQALIAENNLAPGAKYLLTDYVTKYRQPYTNIIKTADIPHGTTVTPKLEESKRERLVLTAKSKNQFSCICESLDFPNDIISYDFNDNLCEDDETPRNGFIQRRIDTANQIDVPHDWRRMLWARFKAMGVTWSANMQVSRKGVYQSGTALYMPYNNGTYASITDIYSFLPIPVSTNEYVWTSDIALTYYDTNQTPPEMLYYLKYDMTDWAERYTFDKTTNHSLKTPSQIDSGEIRNVRIKGGALRTNSELKGLHNSVFQNVTASASSSPKDIYAGNEFYNNTIIHSLRRLRFGDGFKSNAIIAKSGNAVNDLWFGNACNSNFLFLGCNKLHIGDRFSNSVLEGAYGHVIQDDCNNSIFGRNSRDCFIMNQCVGNTYGLGFRYNIVHPFVQNKSMTAISELHSKDYVHEITKQADGSVMARHLSNKTPVYTAVP